MDELLQAQLARPFFLEVGARAIPADFESYVNQVGIEERRAATAYVFRASPDQVQSLATADAHLALTELRRKASDVPIFALSFDGVHQLHRVDVQGVARLTANEEKTAIQRLRTLDLHGVVNEAEDLCYFRATKFEHFIAPSGEHCEVFFRLGDAIRSKRALDRLVFWTVPILASAGGIIVDNWSIATLALRTLHQLKHDAPFDCLASHPRQDRRDAEVIIARMIKDELAPDGTLVFLVSVTSSGSYASIVREIAAQYLPEERIKVIAVYGLTGTPSEVERLCTLDFAPRNFHPEACDLCTTGQSTAIPLDPGLYYLKAYPEKPVMLRKEHFVRDGFIDRYHSIPGLFSVHRDDRLRRHHAFHVNVKALIGEAPDFVERFRAAIRRLGEVDLLVTPADDVSQLGSLATEQLNIPRIAADSLRNLSEADEKLLQSARRVLIVDDVLVSGSRIEGYVKALREQTSRPELVNILVGLGRPQSPDALRRHRTAWTTNLPWKAELVVLEEFFLPDWQAHACPWCREFDLLSEAAETVPEPPAWLGERIGRLTEREQGGVREAPLLLLPGVAERSLGHGSLVGPVGASAMACLFSVASALQCLRNDSQRERRLDAKFPLYQVMAAQNLRNYSESLLRAILLRAVAPKEWGVGERQALKQLIASVFAAGEDSSVLAGEILVATGQGTIDRSALGVIGPILSKQHPDAHVILNALVVAEPDAGGARVPARGEERAGARERDKEQAGAVERRRWLLVAVVIAVVLGLTVLWFLH